MRDSLRASLATDPQFDGYAAGSIVVCADCWHPIYALERGIAPGDRAGRAASAFRPLRRADCEALLTRPDLDAGWCRLLSDWLRGDTRTLWEAQRPRAGDEARCPLCEGLFWRVRTVEVADTLDRAYVLEMVTIPPLATRARHRWLGRVTRWVRDPDPLVAVETV